MFQRKPEISPHYLCHQSPNSILNFVRKLRIHSTVLPRSNHWISDLKLMYHSNILGGKWTYIEHNSVVLSCNICCSGKAISITHSDCVFVYLGIQLAMWLSDPTVFFTLSHKRQDLKKKFLYIMCVCFDLLSNFSETFLILRRIERDLIKSFISLHVKYSLLLSDI
jgi:hypothetical protein